jgi:hypothetical protein
LSITSMIVIERVDGERGGDDGARCEAGAHERPGGEGEAEDVGESDGERDRSHIAPAQRRRDEHAGDLADHAAGQAVVRGADREPVHSRALGCVGGAVLHASLVSFRVSL